MCNISSIYYVNLLIHVKSNMHLFMEIYCDLSRTHLQDLLGEVCRGLCPGGPVLVFHVADLKGICHLGDVV